MYPPFYLYLFSSFWSFFAMSLIDSGYHSSHQYSRIPAIAEVTRRNFCISRQVVRFLSSTTFEKCEIEAFCY